MKNVLVSPRKTESISFLRQFMMYLDGGYSLYDTWKVCSQIFKGKKKYAFISRICTLLEEGYPWKLSIQSVLSKHSDLYGLAWAKNQSGLLKCARHILESIQRTQGLLQSVVASLLYPSFVFIGLIITLIVYQKIIRPQFYVHLPEAGTWSGIVAPLITGVVLLAFLAGVLFSYIRPMRGAVSKHIARVLPGLYKISSLRIWELLLVHIDVRVAGGFTLWDAISSARKTYGSGNEGRQLGDIQRSLFENRNLRNSVLNGKYIPECIRDILYSSLNCNKVAENLPLMQTIISNELKRIIAGITILIGPISIIISGWAVLGLCLDILIPIHQFLGRDIL